MFHSNDTTCVIKAEHETSRQTRKLFTRRNPFNTRAHTLMRPTRDVRDVRAPASTHTGTDIYPAGRPERVIQNTTHEGYDSTSPATGGSIHIEATRATSASAEPTIPGAHLENS